MLKNKNLIKNKKMNQRSSYRKEKLIKTWMDLLFLDKKVSCFNQFEYGKPTYASPLPSIFMTIRKPLEP